MLISDWQNRKTSDRKQINQKLRKLEQQKGKKLDLLADEVHEEVFAELNCLDCAGCCSHIPPMLTRADVSRIAKCLGMSVSDFQEQYLRMDEDGDMVMKTTPCPFLQEDNRCLIYEDRPKACRQYPHTDQQEFSRYFKLHKQNVRHCPAVFHIVERIFERI